MSEWKKYKRKDTQWMRPYVPGETLPFTVAPEHPPKEGDMIGRDESNQQWLILAEHFAEIYEQPAMTE